MSQDKLPVSEAKSFSDMNASEKLAHLGKVVLFLASFGFAYPNIFSE